MYSKKILIVIPIVITVVLIGVIYMDSLERSDANDAGSVKPEQHHSSERTYAKEPGPEDLERILTIEQELEGLDNENLAIAFMGEIIQIYMNNDRLDGAAEAAERRAGLTGEFEDWKKAGDWYHEWMLKESDQEYIHYFSQKSASMYEAALEVDSVHAKVRTDMAVEYMRLGQPDKAIWNLEKVLGHDPDFLNANYNLGVILHQMGKKDKSISYLKRSLELAEGTEKEETVRNFLQQNEIKTL
ncbi:MAG: tetratricopeptide repeat protein [Balneolales bacterium]